MSGSAGSSQVSVLRTDFVGFILTALFVAVLVLVIFLLGALQFKDNIDNSPIRSPQPNAGNVRQGVSTLEGSYGRSAKLIAQREDIEKQIENLDSARRDTDDKLIKIQADVSTAVLNAIQGYSDPVIASITYPLAGDVDATNYLKIRLVFARYQAAVERAISANGDRNFQKFAWNRLRDTKKAVDQLLAGYDELLANDFDAFNRSQDLQNKTLKTIDQRQREEAVIARLQSPEFRDLCEEIFTYESLFGRLAYEMIFMPKTSLTLMLAVTMGLLGSLIYLARERVIGGTRVGASNIVFRASLGGALAISIYVFAAAGMFAIGQHPAKSDGSVEMSPYLISFIGITAGYLSDHMAAWMAQIGRQAFKIDGVEGKERWAPHVGLYMVARTPADIARALNVPLAQVEDWIALKLAVPAEMQPLLAVFLDTDMSLLFSDIPPRSARTS